ncbi:hypothetical protein HK104_001208 [Borealophlyctis nickersoniae]|nr:hypothetical protein HK104_001208 [Borealophlyctis nickersoniae]
MSEWNSSLAGPANAIISNKFVTEAELQANRHERETAAKNEGKELVEVYDPRPLYEKLAEKKRLEEEAFNEKMKFSNLVKRLDEEEFEFLANYDEQEARRQREIALNDQKELEKFRAAVVEPPIEPSKVAAGALGVSLVRPLVVQPAKKTPPVRDVQKSVLQGIVRKRKSDQVDAAGGKPNPKPAEPSTAEPSSKKTKSMVGSNSVKVSSTSQKGTVAKVSDKALQPSNNINPLALLGAYDDSEDEED